MALSFMIRRASSPVLPLAIRAVGSPRSFHGAIATAVNIHERTILSRKSSFQSHSYSSAAGSSGAKKLVDESLIRIINSGIKSKNSLKETLKGFPFEIEINSAEETIVLTRVDGDEFIGVRVDMTALQDSLGDRDNDDSVSDDSDDSEDGSCEETDTDKDKNLDSENMTSCDDSDDSDDDNDDSGDDSNKTIKNNEIPIMVSVIKSGIALDFDVVASANKIAINSLTIKEPTDGGLEFYEGTRSWELDPELKHAFHRYLEIRMINPSMFEYLQIYIINKNNKEEMQWLKKLRKFIKK